ncbi:MAG: hypothetical protein LBN26_00100 [Christensenellaceae bacterium]|nr:hypothetical protein [Christensenellaceae bacterium]
MKIMHTLKGKMMRQSIAAARVSPYAFIFTSGVRYWGELFFYYYFANAAHGRPQRQPAC